MKSLIITAVAAIALTAAANDGITTTPRTVNDLLQSRPDSVDLQLPAGDIENGHILDIGTEVTAPEADDEPEACDNSAIISILDAQHIRIALNVLYAQYDPTFAREASRQYAAVNDSALYDEYGYIYDALSTYQAEYANFVKLLKKRQDEFNRIDPAGRKLWRNELLGELKSLPYHRSRLGKQAPFAYLSDIATRIENRIHTCAKTDAVVELADFIMALNVEPFSSDVLRAPLYPPYDNSGCSICEQETNRLNRDTDVSYATYARLILAMPYDRNLTTSAIEKLDAISNAVYKADCQRIRGALEAYGAVNSRMTDYVKSLAESASKLREFDAGWYADARAQLNAIPVTGYPHLQRLRDIIADRLGRNQQSHTPPAKLHFDDIYILLLPVE